MATDRTHPRFAVHPISDPSEPHGAWWPASRCLSTELREFVAQWPAGEARILRLLYSPPDWDDRPRSVSVGERRVKTGCFPADDTQLLTLSLTNGTRRMITVIAPGAPPESAARVLAGFNAG